MTIEIASIQITKKTYDAIYAELERNNDVHAMPYFIENVMRRWLQNQAYFESLSKKPKEELTEEEIEDLVNNEIHNHRDAKYRPKGF